MFILKKQDIILSPNESLNFFTPSLNPLPLLLDHNNKNNNKNNENNNENNNDNEKKVLLFEKNGDLKRNQEHKRGRFKGQPRLWQGEIEKRGERERGG